MKHVLSSRGPHKITWKLESLIRPTMWKFTVWVFTRRLPHWDAIKYVIPLGYEPTTLVKPLWSGRAAFLPVGLEFDTCELVVVIEFMCSWDLSPLTSNHRYPCKGTSMHWCLYTHLLVMNTLCHVQTFLIGCTDTASKAAGTSEKLQPSHQTSGYRGRAVTTVLLSEEQSLRYTLYGTEISWENVSCERVRKSIE